MIPASKFFKNYTICHVNYFPDTFGSCLTYRISGIFQCMKTRAIKKFTDGNFRMTLSLRN